MRPLRRAGLAAVALLVGGTARADDAWWIVPVERVAVELAAIHEDDRPYPTDVAGEIALSCEQQQGRPCGDGAGGFAEVDSAGGFGDHVTAATRLRATGGTGGFAPDLAIDRAHVDAHFGPLALSAGRDALFFGPSSHTQVGWGDNAVPLDHVRAVLAGHGGELTYVVGRLRAPQTYPGTLVAIARGQLTLGDRVTVGAMQLIELEGQGAPHLGLWDFVKEQVTRGNASAGPDDTSNRRVGLDVAWRIAGFDGARFYYELMFEDWRRQFASALRYDADHVVGLDFSHGLLIEWQKTGFRSEEHVPRTSGFTNAGRVVGDPLGPDAQALYVAQRIGVGQGQITPWLEVASLANDTYSYGYHQPIVRLTEGTAEVRYRVGTKLATPVTHQLAIALDAFYEYVDAFAFVAGAVRQNVGLTTTFVWTP